MTLDAAAALSKLLSELSDDEEWANGPGIALESLDNPGWALRLCISGTSYEGIQFPRRFLERSETDWIALQVNQEGYERYLCIYCGVGNLKEALEQFFEILEKHGERSR